MIYPKPLDFDFSKVSDPLAFKEHLTDQELYRLQKKEDELDASRKKLHEFYNEIVSNRISHQMLIAEVMKELPSTSKELKDKLNVMEDEVLQAILSVLKYRESSNCTQ